ncbi:ATP-dependent metallopeptidase FtsH/Yme1/Tma family protein [Rhizobium halophilum]|uniref:hypothetical protein n=1 Tax=Rhizobium halophilum TaxID=2846852 RepID=UPI001EFC7E7C|nr:hypothetical protein [Rhizobium halophilum]MCF6368133.1 hypothetical protein [Rhizobium halophilum]
MISSTNEQESQTFRSDRAQENGRGQDLLSTQDDAAAHALLRLATRAMGLTGADIERVVREARLKARREKRPLTYADLEAGIRGHRPPLPHDVRWRLAVHESGHAVVHHALRLGSVKGLTIDAKDGGHNAITFGDGGPDTAEWYERLLALLMAGRAAELIVLKTASAGSGGAEHSDLARATRIATSMEQTLGFGTRHPLLYLEHPDPTAILAVTPTLQSAFISGLSSPRHERRTPFWKTGRFLTGRSARSLMARRSTVMQSRRSSPRRPDAPSSTPSSREGRRLDHTLFNWL